jgi:glucokinase
MPVLVGDLGGTHTRLALAHCESNTYTAGNPSAPIELTHSTRYLNSEHDNLHEILARYLTEPPLTEQHVSGALSCCLAVAGPTDGRSVQFTNLNWRIETTDLMHAFSFSACQLVNDFTAVGWGLNTLEKNALHPLQTGQALGGGARVALGAGTGLGVSLCAWRDDHYQPLASEGGHVSFAPCTAEQDRLLAFMRTHYQRVSIERLLSGPGLIDLFRFCLKEQAVSHSALLTNPHPAQAISQAGLEKSDPIARHCLHLFAEIYGQTAGDWALATQARGGIFLAGGIAPKLLPILQSASFLAAFNAKGRYSDWMHSVPVNVILDPDIGLKGAAYAAHRHQLNNPRHNP